jgi:hypothetical protein
VSTEHTRKCNRVDRRMRRARELLGMWGDGREPVVLREIGGNARTLAAVVHAARTADEVFAAETICEAIARERMP